MNRLTFFITIILIGFFVSSCEDSNTPTPTVISKRTVLVYIIATNSLGSSGYDKKDIAEMDMAISSFNTNNCRLLVYWVSNSSNPKLFEISKSKSGVSHNTLKEYSSAIKSTSTQRMKEVITDVEVFAPALEYGLVLWSHASGWAKSLNKTRLHGANSISLLDFGEDKGASMPIDTLALSLKDGMFEFIYTDACYMGAVEIAYELRSKTKYFIGSPTELPNDGMPYQENIPCFFSNIPQLLQSCQNTFDSYNFQTGAARSCTISLIDCSYLTDLKDVCAEIIANGKTIEDISSIQRYKLETPYLFFDFYQYMGLLANEEQQAKLEAVLSDVVIYKASTPSVFFLSINPDHYSGLSTYILGTSSATNEDYYKALQWYKDVYNIPTEAKSAHNFKSDKTK